MITDNDVKKLANVFATKNDLVAMEARQDKKYATKDDLKRDLQAMEARQDKKYATKDDLKDMKDMLLDDIDGKLKKQKEEIVEAVGEYITDTVVPIFDKHDQRIERVEKNLNLPVLAVQ